MFTYTDPTADDTLLSSVGAEGLGAFARDALRLSRQAEARGLLMAYRIGESAYNERLFGADGRHRMIFGQTARNAAVGEISLALRINRTKAGEWYSLGASLQEYPKIRMAYLAGEFSTHRMSVMVHAADIAPKGDLRDQLPDPDDTTDDDSADEPSDPTLDDLLDDEADDTDPDAEVQPEPQPDGDEPVSFEDLALELGNRASTDTALRDDLADAVISLDPDGAAESRDAIAEAFENITFSNEAGGHMNLDARMPAEHGVHLRDRISALVAVRVCKSDPRTLGRQRILAFGEIVGIPGSTLTCECGEDTSTAGQVRTSRGKRSAKSSGRAAGANSSSPTNADQDAGLGPATPTATEDESESTTAQSAGSDSSNPTNTVDPDDAQVETTETSDREADQGDDNDGEDRSTASASIIAPSDTDPATTAEDHDTTDTADVSDDHDVAETDLKPADDGFTAFDNSADGDPASPAWTLLHDPTGTEPTRLQGYGAIDPAHANRLSPQAKIITIPTLTTPKPASRLIVVGDRALAPPIDPTGHGGFDIPPPGALIYRPSDRLRAEITYLDRRCRYPYCSRPSHECELDHLVKFNHADPLAGGWSVPYNFAPLCRPDHHRKHDGGWVPAMHTDRTISWRNLRTGETIITHPR
ncbi:HNH endonuclease signature motif containing protein [Gordonia sp. PKS22-38]|uniref:HNH endonuclease signature motif containing protein n=1 Tax=Gordonia prachuapensis TaxID=3115651 RepID=A0ABU7MZC0_9ACTN|nr:HNH endonuclease signature motif containing protein [Gordonia sp. PKS22-38]